MGIVRLILALSVVVGHSGTTIFGYELLRPHLAVLMFYIISGFYMSMVLNEKYSTLPDGTRRFYLNRVLRLYPVYFVVLLLTIFCDWVRGQPTVFLNSQPDVSALERVGFILLNLSIVGQDFASTLSDKFNSEPNYLISPAWTIGSELLFYAVAPFLLVLSKKRVRYVVALFIAIVAVRMVFEFFPEASTRFFVSLGFTDDQAWKIVARLPGRYRIIFFSLPIFLLGFFSYLIYLRLPTLKPWLKNTWRCAVVLALFYIAYSLWRYKMPDHIAHHDRIDGIVYWSAYLLFVASIPFLFTWSRNWKLDRFIGELSYPIYVLHLTPILMVHWAWPDYAASPASIWLMLGIILPGALLLHFLVERPVDRLRLRISRET